MNDYRISPDDPKLTAYALGQLEGDERAAVEEALRHDPEARAIVEQTQVFATQLEEALKNEPEPEATASPDHAQAAATAPGPEADKNEITEYDRPPPKLLRFPQLYYVIGSLAAACVAVVIALRQKPETEVRYVEVQLNPRPAAPAPSTTSAASIPAVMPASPAAPAPVAVSSTPDMITTPAEQRAPEERVTDKHMEARETPAVGEVMANTSKPEESGDVIKLSPFAVKADAGTGYQASSTLAGSRLNAPETNPTALAQIREAATLPLSSSGQVAAVGGSLTLPKSSDNLVLLQQAKEHAAPHVAYTPPVTLNVQTQSSGGVVPKPAANRVESTLAGTRVRMQAVSSDTDRSTSGRVLSYPPDDKFVVKVQPQSKAVPNDYIDTVPNPSVQAPIIGNNGALADKGSGTYFYGSKTPRWGSSGTGGLGPAAQTFTNHLDDILNRGAPAAPVDQYDLLPGPARRDRANTEAYAYERDNTFVAAAQVPFSTFSVDVDTASYSNVRRFIAGGQLPPADAVRIEELLNYFPYHYPAPVAPTAAQTLVGTRIREKSVATKGETGAPVAASLEIAEAPWAPTHRLVRIGLKAREVTTTDRPAANLVFLLDVSGSMASPNKLPLVKQSLRLLVDKLRSDDRVAIVTYAGNSGLALSSTPVAKARDIIGALDDLSAGGSTNGGMGIQLAYDVAKANFITGGINRVILCTDGDFNVGVTSQGELARLVEEKAKSGVALTVLGFGMGNYKDSTLELLADKGNGNYGYIDGRREAEKVLAQQVNATLVTMAKDVKVQVDFNPARVASYRLIGYEDRVLNAQDFNDDKVDAGEIGAGHAVTALYEVVPVGVRDDSTSMPPIDRSKYVAAADQQRGANAAIANELLTVKVRYKDPLGDESTKLEFPLTDSAEKFADASSDFKFAAAVAEFGMILRNSPYRGTATLGDVVAWASSAATKPADDPGGYRSDFVDLARRAQALMR